MNNLNEYNEEKFKHAFENSTIFQQISNDFDYIIWDKNRTHRMYHTARQVMGQKTFYVTPFYYIEKLTEKNPDIILDIGCGWNIFKKYIPNIIGLDIDFDNINFFADIKGFVNDEYVKLHKNYFESAFSINALHFGSISNLENIIVNFVSMIKPKGRGFLALNFQRLLDNSSPEELIRIFDTSEPTTIDYENYIRLVLSKIECEYLVVDIDLTVMDEYLNGNIRIVFEKC